MELLYPFEISPRLHPSLKIGDSWLSYDLSTGMFRVDTPAWSEEITDYSPGCGITIQDTFEDILSFMLCAVEEDLFSERITAFCIEHLEIIEGLTTDLTVPNLIRSA